MISLNQYLLGGLIILSLLGYGYFEHSRFLRTKAEYSEFIAKTEALAEKARTDNLKKEMEYAKKVADAVRARDITFAKLREYQSRTAGNRMSITPIGTENRLCFDRTRFNDSLQSFLGEVEDLLARGDCAIVESKTCYEAWPQ